VSRYPVLIVILLCMLLYGCAGPGSRDDIAIPLEVVRDSTLPATSYDGITLTIDTDKSQYRVDEPVRLDYCIKNIGSMFRCVYSELYRGQGWLVFLDILKDGLPEHRSRPVTIDRSPALSHYAWLPPGGSLCQNYTWKPKEPGTYHVSAEYVNLDFEIVLASFTLTKKDIDILGKRAYVPLWTGKVRSNTIELKVTN